MESRLLNTTTHFSKLHCAECGNSYPADRVNTVASCDRCTKNVLLCDYEPPEDCSLDGIDATERSMWRYLPWLPVFDRASIVSLGEGLTPIVPLTQIGRALDMPDLILKDESFNPTGSFKARGMSMAISKAKELGITRCIVPTAGNAGGAMAAYCAKAGMEAVVVMPEHTPAAFRLECEAFGAKVILVKGLISDCARHVVEINRGSEYFDLSTLKEPYRLEGKKTMGYEIAEQGNWELPDVILYPTGGGTGLIGMWKAFHEMHAMGWISNKFPRMYSVQAAACCPIVETWEGRQENAKSYVGRATQANGLAVPNPMGEALILQVLRESGGIPVAISEEEITQARGEFAQKEGLFLAPEGAALVPALRRMIDLELIDRAERVLLLNTGSGYKYM
jgi:threonine synthase